MRRTVILFAAVCLTPASLCEANASFVGKWKINWNKSIATGKIEYVGNHEFRFITDGHTDVVFIDGKEHPTRQGHTRSFTPEGSNRWRSVLKRNGRIYRTELWTLSDDEKTLKYSLNGKDGDSSTYKEEIQSKRISGTSGLAGTWQTIQASRSATTDWNIEPLGSDGLVFVMSKARYPVKLDGRDYAGEGPHAVPGLTTAARRIDERTIEMIIKSNGNVRRTHRMRLSADGVTLTTTITYPGRKEREVDVYYRQ